MLAAVASLVATVSSGAFAVALLRRYAAGGRANRALLFWGASLTMFCLASLLLLVGVVVGWSSASFRGFYLFGAALNVPWLALGSVAVNAPSRVVTRITGGVTLAVAALFALGLAGPTPLLWAPGVVLGALWGLLLATADPDGVVASGQALLAVFSLVAVLSVLSVGFTQPLPTEGLPEGSQLLPVVVRGLAVAGNGIGAVIVVVSAVASAVNLVWRRPAPQAAATLRSEARRAPVEALANWLFGGRRGVDLPHLVRGNLLIAAGTLVAAAGGAWSFLGDTTGHAVGIALGVTIMFVGFVRTSRPPATSTAAGAARADR